MPKKKTYRTPTTLKGKYETIDKAQLSEQAKSVLATFTKDTKHFKNVSPENKEFFLKFYNALKAKKPEAVKGTPQYKAARAAKEKKTTTLPKEVKTKAQILKEVLKEEKVKKAYRGVGKGSLEIDSKRGAYHGSGGAKPFGWRYRGSNYSKPTAKDIREKNNVYYEARPNRADVRRRMPLLAKGGIIGSFKVGQTVRISSENDNDNYDEYRNKDLVITHKATNEKQHRGFDSSIGQALYDLKVKKTGKEVPFSLYDYELENTRYAKGGYINHTEELKKELYRLQRQLNSPRLMSYREGDNSEEEQARQRERASKMERFDQVLKELRESGDKFAKGGQTKKLDLKTIQKRWDRNENWNRHSENIVLLAEQFGSPEDIKEAKAILKEHHDVGYLTDDLNKRRMKLHDKLYPMLKGGGKKTSKDLFEHPDEIPPKIKAVIDEYPDAGYGDYEAMRKLLIKLEPYGYVFDWDKQGIPYGLRPVGTTLEKDSKGHFDSGGMVGHKISFTYPYAGDSKLTQRAKVLKDEGSQLYVEVLNGEMKGQTTYIQKSMIDEKYASGGELSEDEKGIIHKDQLQFRFK